MGLVKCPDCGKDFSDRISACPNCGCPAGEAAKGEFYLDEIIKRFLFTEFSEYLDLTVEVNEEIPRSPENLASYLERFANLYQSASEMYTSLPKAHRTETDGVKKQLYHVFEQTLLWYSELMKEYQSMLRKVLGKNSGGKYGFFERSKDSKRRAKLEKDVVLAYRELKRLYSEVSAADK